MIGHIVRPVDFERVLRVRSRASSPHFALHHLAGRPAARGKPSPAPGDPKLSTTDAPIVTPPVDESIEAGHWLGLVVPKRHARRAVTRSLLKRQIRAAMLRHGGDLPAGLWVVRLRSPFDRARFPSAASEALKQAARAELDQVLAAAHLPAGR